MISCRKCFNQGAMAKKLSRKPVVELQTAEQPKSRARNSKGQSFGDGRRELWLCLALGLVILIFYANSFNAGLLFDSDTLIRQDPRVRALSWTNIKQILTHDYWWPAQESIIYRPLTTFT